MPGLQFKRITPIKGSERSSKRYYFGNSDSVPSIKKIADTEKAKEEIRTEQKAIFKEVVTEIPKIQKIEKAQKSTSSVIVTKPVSASGERWISNPIIYGTRGTSNRCVIAIPVYKTFSGSKPEEQASIRQVIKILGGKYDLILFHPEGLDVTGYNIDGYAFSSVAMNKDFFRRQKTYSNLCERWEFYDTFKDYEYMLIYQTDAWIFEDKLEYFMNMGYDYIGGVHLMWTRAGQGENGNGGFSLRKISRFIEVCKRVDWSKVPYGQLEDCAFTQKFKDEFNLAPIEICYEFSWHEKGSTCFKKTKKLPMGCHAFKKHDYFFWKDYIKI